VCLPYLLSIIEFAGLFVAVITVQCSAVGIEGAGVDWAVVSLDSNQVQNFTLSKFHEFSRLLVSVKALGNKGFSVAPWCYLYLAQLAAAHR
jgi:hypothetical protein